MMVSIPAGPSVVQAGLSPRFKPVCCRLVELAPQYYLGNLPPSDGRDLLMGLRQSLFPPDEQEANPQDEAGDESRAETCSVQ